MATMTRARRRTPTAEQLAKSADRRERFKKLAQAVGAMNDDERAAMVTRMGAIVTCEGRALSQFNSCLLLSQFHGVRMVGGFWQWQRSGRRVRKGESALSLWIPTSGKGDATPTDGSESQGDGESKGGRRSFVIGSVFDISQTQPIDESTAEVLDEREGE